MEHLGGISKPLSLEGLIDVAAVQAKLGQVDVGRHSAQLKSRLQD